MAQVLGYCAKRTKSQNRTLLMLNCAVIASLPVLSFCGHESSMEREDAPDGMIAYCIAVSGGLRL